MSAVPIPNHDREPRVPPLEMGDRLTRFEFERRFDATPGLKKAELLDGIVYMPPPVSHSYHSDPHSQLITLLGIYRAETPGVESGTEGSLRLDLDDMPQPDAYLMIRADHGGQAKIDEDGYIEGAPELVAEVAASSASYDLHVKKNVYRRSGVREYIAWRTYDRAIDYFVLVNGRYDRLPMQEGIYKSQVFPGLWLAADGLLQGDLAGALRMIQEGTATKEHAEFKAHLQRARG